MAEEDIRIAGRGDAALQRDPGDIAARGDALVGAWLCGTVLGSITIGLHHKLCHTLGGSFDLPHAEVHAVILPQAMAYNAPAGGGGAGAIARAWARRAPPRTGCSISAGRMARRRRWRRSACAPPTSTGPPGCAVQNAYPNPRPLERTAVRDLLQRAFDGARPD